MPPYEHDHDNEVVVFAETDFRNQRKKFGIKTDDRRRHVYVLGKSGAGKTTLLENMILEDIYAGHGVGFIDPHGDSSEKLLDYIPSHRINDIVYFNPADVEYPVGFNILETVDETHKHLVTAGLMGIFKKIWEDQWSARMEYILNNAILALLDYPGSTLLGINRLLSDKEYRQKVISQIKDPVVKAFWLKEFAGYQQKFASEAVAPIQNKVGQFLSASIIRNIVAQVKSTINVRQIIDEGKIFIMDLSKGRIGEDTSRLLGGMLITKLQLAAMERVDMPEKERKDFYLYVDEFQNFAYGSFSEILSEARKYRLNLILAHQYIAQLDEKVRDAVFGNVGTHIMFRLGAADATFLEEEFTPVFTPEDLVSLANHDIYLKLLINGAASQPFSATTLPPIGMPTGSRDKVIKVSRERYSANKKDIEEKIERWWGFGEGEDGAPGLSPRDSGPAPFGGGSGFRRPPDDRRRDEPYERRGRDYSQPYRREYDSDRPFSDRPPRNRYQSSPAVGSRVSESRNFADERPARPELAALPPAPLPKEISLDVLRAEKSFLPAKKDISVLEKSSPDSHSRRREEGGIPPPTPPLSTRGEKSFSSSSSVIQGESVRSFPPPSKGGSTRFFPPPSKGGGEVGDLRKKSPRSYSLSEKSSSRTYPAVCSRCKKDALAKFRPDPRKPYYCDDCLVIVKEKMRLQAVGPAPALKGDDGRRGVNSQSISNQQSTINNQEISLSALIPRSPKPEKTEPAEESKPKKSEESAPPPPASPQKKNLEEGKKIKLEE